MNNIINLEKTRQLYGVKKLNEEFQKLLNLNKSTAISTINSQNISFYTFFTLIDVIKSNNLQYCLNSKYIFVLNITDENEQKKLDNLHYNKNSEYHDYLLWIFKTGYKFDGYNNDFDELLDYSAVNLLLNYKNYSILNDVCTLIFKRNRENLYNHDLIWAFLKSKNKFLFLEILKYLKSSNIIDREFANELLSQFTNDKVENSYKYWSKWINENNDFLFYSNQHFQLTSNPKCYLIDYDSKFIGKSCINYTKNSFSDNYHTKTLDDLHKYDEETVKTACNHSYFMRNTNKSNWEKLSVDDKVNLATKYAKERL